MDLTKTANMLSDRCAKVYDCPGNMNGKLSGSHVSRTRTPSILSHPPPSDPPRKDNCELPAKSPDFMSGLWYLRPAAARYLPHVFQQMCLISLEYLFYLKKCSIVPPPHIIINKLVCLSFSHCRVMHVLIYPPGKWISVVK